MTVFDDELNDMTASAIEHLTDPDGPYGIDQYVTEFPYGAWTTYRTDIAGVTVDPDVLLERARRIGVGTDLDGTAYWSPLNTEWKYLKTYLSIRALASPDDADPMDVKRGRVPTESFTKDDFHQSLARSRSRDSTWAWLVDNGFLQADAWETNDYGDLVKPARVVDVPLHGTQYAFELKPRDWEHALTQASRSPYGVKASYFTNAPDDIDRSRPTNGGYADHAVVVMDADHVDPALEHADQFRDAGVGLASLDRDGVVEHIEPARQDVVRWSRNRLDLNERTLPDDFELHDR